MFFGAWQPFGTLTAPAPPTGSALALRLEHGALRLGSGAALLEAIDPSLRASPSPTGGVFLHGDFRSSCAAADVALGSLRCSRVLACARCTRYWMAPAVGAIPHDTQFLLIELDGGGGAASEGGAAASRAAGSGAPPSYAVMLPLVDRTARSSLSEPASRLPLSLRRMLGHGGSAGHPSHALRLHVETGDEGVMVPAGAGLVYVAAGSDPYELITRGVAEVAQRLGTFRTREQKVVPPAIDGFGWCTWDGFYSKVRPQDVMAGAASLRKQGVPPRLVILDDGWQAVTPPPPEKLAGPGEPAQPKQLAQPPVVDSATGPARRDAATAAAAAGEEGAAGSSSPAPPPVPSPPIDPTSRLKEAFVASSCRVLVPKLEVWYATTVCRSPEGSFPVRVWAWLARGPLRATLEQFFDTKTDFARQLASFRPNHKFEADADAPASSEPRLASLVAALRREGVRHVYAWHALHGYWRGVASSLGASEGLRVQTVFPRPSRHLLRVEPQLQWDAMVLFGSGLILDPPDLDAFFSKLHAPLVAAGVDGVKVDVQAGLASLGGGVGGPASLARRCVGAAPILCRTRCLDLPRGIFFFNPTTRYLSSAWPPGRGILGLEFSREVLCFDPPPSPPQYRRYPPPPRLPQVRRGARGLCHQELWRQLDPLHVPLDRDSISVPARQPDSGVGRLLPEQDRVAHGACLQRGLQLAARGGDWGARLVRGGGGGGF
jgi:raffinose synthase